MDLERELAAARADPTRQLGPYLILAELGRGGMGVVLRAFDPRLGRQVALKQLLGDPEPEHLIRFRREAQLLGKLQHPGLVKVHEVVLEGPSAPYLVMDLVAGQPLIDLCREPLDPHRAARIVHAACEALVVAHDQGVLHRDLKPHNVMLADGDRPVLLDFGLAKQLDSKSVRLTETGQTLGTPAYMPPEQVDGDRSIDARADVYALGAVLYHALTGHPPFEGATALNIITAVLGKEPVSPRQHVPELHLDLETICLKCLEKNRDRRYDGARALAGDLRRFLAGEPLVARPVPPAARLARRASRWKVPLLLAAVLVVTAVGAALFQVSASVHEHKRVQVHARFAAFQQARRPPAEVPLDVETVASIRSGSLEALRALRIANEDGPPLLEGRLLEGRALLEAGEERASLALAEECLEQGPDSGPAHLLRARALARPSGRLPVPPCDHALAEVADDALAARTSFARAAELGVQLELWDKGWLAYLAGEQGPLDQLEDSPDPRCATVEALLRWKSEPGDPQPALRAIERALEARPADALARQLRGALRLQRWQLDEAIEDFELAHRLEPQPETLLAHAEASFRAGDLEAALALCTRALATRPESVHALALRALVFLEQGNVEAAERELAPAMKLAVACGELRRARSLVLEARGDMNAALREASLAVELAPRQFLTHLQLSRMLKFHSRFDEAAASADEAVRLGPCDPRVFTNRAMLRRMVKNLDGAIEDASKSARLRETYEGRLLQAHLQFEAGRVPAALATLDDMQLKWPREFEVYVNRSDARRALGDREGALADAQAAVALKVNAVAYSRLALAHLQLGAYEASVAAADRAIALEPWLSTPHYARARALHALGRLEEAKQGYRQTVPKKPRLSVRLECERYLAEIAIQQGDPSLALGHRDMAVELAPNDPVQLLRRGLTKSTLGDSRGALADYDSALRMAPTFADAYLERAVLNHRLGRNAEALLDYSEAIELDPRSGRALTNRGILRWNHEQDLEGALSDLSRAIDIAPNDARIRLERANLLIGAAPARAISDFDHVLKLAPRTVDALRGRGFAKRALGNPRAAALDFERALEVEPDQPRADAIRAFVAEHLGRPSRY